VSVQKQWVQIQLHFVQDALFLALRILLAQLGEAKSQPLLQMWVPPNIRRSKEVNVGLVHAQVQTSQLPGLVTMTDF
jgi:hypothetical protein